MRAAERILIMRDDNSMRYEILEHIVTLSSSDDAEGNVWSREVNLVSWNGKHPVLDVRSWNADHSKCSSGATFTETELLTLIKSLKSWQEKRGR